LVLGETIISITYVAEDSEVGLSANFGKAVCGLITAFMLAWLYFDSDASRTFLHALRRNIFTSITYGHLHFPFCAALILIPAALTKMMSRKHSSTGIRWFFCGGIATALGSITLMGWLHMDLDKKGSSLIPRKWRLVVRHLVAVMFALLPLAKHLNNSAILGITAGVLTALVATEQVGKIGGVGDLKRLHFHHQGNQGEYNVDTFENKEDDFVRLTEAEKGEDDVGVEGDLGEIEMKKITQKQWRAYAAW